MIGLGFLLCNSVAFCSLDLVTKSSLQWMQSGGYVSQVSSILIGPFKCTICDGLKCPKLRVCFDVMWKVVIIMRSVSTLFHVVLAYFITKPCCSVTKYPKIECKMPPLLPMRLLSYIVLAITSCELSLSLNS